MNENEEQALKKIVAKLDELYTAKKEADAAEKKFKELKKEVLEFLDATDMDKLEGNNCKVTRVLKSTPKVPKDHEGKNKLFDFIKENYGEEGLLGLQTINPRSFGTFYNAEEQKELTKGNIDFNMPGVEEPYAVSSLQIRKK